MYIDIHGSQYQYVMINIPATALWYCTCTIRHCLPAVYLSNNALEYVLQLHPRYTCFRQQTVRAYDIDRERWVDKVSHRVFLHPSISRMEEDQYQVEATTG